MKVDEAQRIMRVFTSAFPTYPYGDDTAELYEGVLCRQVDDPGLALAVAVDWVMERITFPKPAEIVEECAAEYGRRQRRQRQIRSAQAHHQPGLVACRRCEDSGWVQTTDAAGYVWASPCPDCEAERAEYWAAGHYEADHVVGDCEHPFCVKRAKLRGSRRPATVR